MLKNPILKGFNPDPCICRKGGDYYIAVSTFEWFPGIPVYHSNDCLLYTSIAYFCYDGYTGECYGNEIISW